MLVNSLRIPSSSAKHGNRTIPSDLGADQRQAIAQNPSDGVERCVSRLQAAHAAQKAVRHPLPNVNLGVYARSGARSA